LFVNLKNSTGREQFFDHVDDHIDLHFLSHEYTCTYFIDSCITIDETVEHISRSNEEVHVSRWIHFFVEKIRENGHDFIDIAVFLN